MKFLNNTGLQYFWNKIKYMFLSVQGGNLNGNLNMLGNITENEDGMHSIGTSSKKFLNVYTKNLYADNINCFNLLKLIFPVGSTYITQTNTNPSTILGFGNWERVKGKVLVGLDEDDTDFNTIGKIGGEKTHTLTVNEIPDHNHVVKLAYRMNIQSNANVGVPIDGSRNDQDATVKTASAGGGKAHNNLQPYKVVGYMWIRTE